MSNQLLFEHILQQVHLHIAAYIRLHANVPKIEIIADELHWSIRTLQRQLNTQNSSFKKVLETERMKRCEQLLVQGISFSDIAMQLGYSDQSALARAYKAFSGQTLMQRKKQLK